MSRVTEEVRNEYENRQGVYTPGPLALRGVEEYEDYLDNYLRQLSGNPYPDWVKLFSSTVGQDGKCTTYTAVGHTLKIAAVQKTGGKMEGKWYIRCGGPSVTSTSGIKTLYCAPSIDAAKERAARFLGCPVSAVVSLSYDVQDQIEHVFRLNEDIFEKFEFLSDGLEAFLRVLDEFAKANPEKLLACLTDLTFFIGLINGAKQMQLYLDPENRSESLHGEPLFKKTLTILQRGARGLVFQLVGDVMFFRSETNRLPDVSLGDL